ncbi:MAG: hypothetical protein JWM12_1337 [Ilumatobacteraceae bacterium]|nr:hypothetical protein [Ilumatobacteraceae bacterium]
MSDADHAGDRAQEAADEGSGAGERIEEHRADPDWRATAR